MLAYKTRINKKNRGNSFAGTLTMKCNFANEKIIKPALPSLLWSHCIALFKARGCSNSSVGYDFENMLFRPKNLNTLRFLFLYTVHIVTIFNYCLERTDFQLKQDL